MLNDLGQLTQLGRARARIQTPVVWLQTHIPQHATAIGHFTSILVSWSLAKFHVKEGGDQRKEGLLTVKVSQHCVAPMIASQTQDLSSPHTATRLPSHPFHDVSREDFQKCYPSPGISERNSPDSGVQVAQDLNTVTVPGRHAESAGW